ncbi:putative cyclic di-GMP phosphodiesterase VC_1348 [Gammaproteobacteria bacterium]
MSDTSNFTNRPTILIVDDTPDNLARISLLLKGSYHVRVAKNGEKALNYLRNNDNPDLILLDIMMPGMSGYDVIRELKANPATSHIPVIFLTGANTAEDEKQGLDLGAADYITKPISPPIMLARVKTQLENKTAADFLRNQNAYLEAEVVRRTREISTIQDVTVMAMASLSETRDQETGNHILRTQYYMKVLAEKLRTHPRFNLFLSERVIEMLFRAAALHDLGKVGVPDRVLLKPDHLTPEEFEIMKTHTTLGRNAIELTEKRLGVKIEFFRHVMDVAYYHHEKWDGSGYPTGICGDNIPIPARLMAVADVYDALISRRVYKKGMSHKKAMEIIIAARDHHFDPDIVDAFVDVQDEFRTIAIRFSDTDEHINEKVRSMEQMRGTNP